EAGVHRRHAARGKRSDRPQGIEIAAECGYRDLPPSRDQPARRDRLPVRTLRAHQEKGRLMRLRSLLFVPGDRPERFAKAAASGADAIILDLEDSVALANKEAARAAVADYLSGEREVITLVRVNPLDGHMTAADVAAVAGARPDAIMLPKAEG